MGDWHQDLVVVNAADEELDFLIKKMVDYLIDTKIISAKMADNVLGSDLGYCPGENWKHAVQYPEEDHFLSSLTNGMEVRKGRSIFYSSSSGFETMNCPNCGTDNSECDWGALFGMWLEDANSADLECEGCGMSSSISKYEFDPLWMLSNLGFTFWNWPIIKDSFISELEPVIGKKIKMVSGKL